MDKINDPKQAGERLLVYVRDGRLVQHAWHAEQGGREVACLLGAAAGIADASQCPASLMPSWVAHALPALFDRQSTPHAIAFAVRWGEAMVRPEWQRLAWGAVRDEWMAFVVSQAKDAAAVAVAAKYAAAAAADAAVAAKYADADAAAADAVAAKYAAAAAAAADAAAAAAAVADASDAQADALMDAIERAMEVARG